VLGRQRGDEQKNKKTKRIRPGQKIHRKNQLIETCALDLEPYYKEFILKGTINNTVPFLRDGSFKTHNQEHKEQEKHEYSDKGRNSKMKALVLRTFDQYLAPLP
jgi:hypothetical protein